MKLTKAPIHSLFRKIAMGSWQAVGDPSVYGLIEIDVTNAKKFLIQKQKNCQYPLTLTHFVGKVVANVMKERPEINGLIRRGHIYNRDGVDIFYQVNIPGKDGDSVKSATLSGVTLRRVEDLSLEQIAEQLGSRAAHIKKGGVGEFTKSTDNMRLVPVPLVKWVLNITSFLNFDIGLNLTWAGVPRDPFGSVMITNVGGMGIDCAWAPLVPYTRVPLLLTMGEIRERPWVVDSQVVVRPVMRVGITFDHRFMDGVHAAAMSRQFQKCFDQPELYLQ